LLSRDRTEDRTRQEEKEHDGTKNRTGPERNAQNRNRQDRMGHDVTGQDRTSQERKAQGRNKRDRMGQNVIGQDRTSQERNSRTGEADTGQDRVLNMPGQQRINTVR
jgi:hypothetical protein